MTLVSDPHAHATRPSWTVPIVVGTLLTFLANAAGIFEVGFGFCSCCGVTSLVAVVPVILALAKNRQLGALNGMIIGGLSSFLGMLPVSVLGLMMLDMAAIESQRDQMIVDMRQRMEGSGQQMSDQELEQLVDTIIQAFGYLPVLNLFVVTFLGALLGLIVAAIGTRPGQPAHA